MDVTINLPTSEKTKQDLRRDEARDRTGNHNTRKEPEQNMTIDAPTAALIGAAIGAITGIAGSITTVWVTQIHESRRHLRETIFKTAFDQWMADRKVAEERNLTMASLMTYLIGMMKLVEITDKGKITPDRALAWAKECNTIVSMIQKENVEFTKREHGERKQSH